MEQSTQIIDKHSLYGYTLEGVIRNSRIANNKSAARRSLLVTDVYDAGEMLECIVSTITDSYIANVPTHEVLKDIDAGFLAFIDIVPKTHVKHLRKGLQKK